MAPKKEDKAVDIPKPKVLPKVINGGIAGIIGVSVVYPLDLIKTRLQNQKPGADGKLPYRSFIDCFRKTYAESGYFGMYKGSAINIILITPEKAIKLSANDMFRYYLTLKDGSLPIPRQMLAGACAGTMQIVVTTPMELLKIKLQVSGQAAALAKAAGKKFKEVTTMSLIRDLMKDRGILGLYQGVSETAGRDVSFSIIYFPLFATLNGLGPIEPGKTGPPFWWQFLSGNLAGSIGAVAVTPLDVIKTRMQLSKPGGEHDYSSVFECVTKTMKNEGATAFFKGGACRMIVIAPLFGIAQTIYYIGIAENYLGINF